jgi:hypothetical protein
MEFGIEKLTAEFKANNINYVCVPLEVDEIVEFCRQESIPNDRRARAQLAAQKLSETQGEEEA